MNRFSATYLKIILVVFISLSALSSCKEDTILNANIVPAGDTINAIIIPDTFTILTKTILNDSVITNNLRRSRSGLPINVPLGVLASDPYSGITRSGFYFDIIPPSLSFDIPVTPDSAILILPYAGFTWGDTNAVLPQSFTVHELTDTLNRSDSAKYYAFSTTAFHTNPLGSFTISNLSDLKDSVADGGANRAPHVRVKLNTDFINKFANADPATQTNSYDNFRLFFKGFYVQPTTTAGNAQFYFRLNGIADYQRAGVIFYYTQNGENKTASYYYDDERSSYYYHISRDYTGTPTGALMQSNHPSDSVFVIQSGYGAALDITIPGIKNLPKKPINKAELIITQYAFVGDNSPIYYGPARIYPERLNADGSVSFIQDRYPTSSTEALLFIDGSEKIITIGGMTLRQYKLNIPREVQKTIVEEKDALHLRITGSSLYPGAYRFIGSGRNAANPDIDIRLNIIFTKI